jgi:signal transduction histidine kinase
MTTHNFHKPTLSRDYKLFAGIVSVIIVGLCLLFTHSVYKTQVSQRNHQLQTSANRLDRTLTDSYDYILYLVQFIGKRISVVGADDPNYITELLGNFWQENRVRSIISWTGLDWVSPNDEIVINSSNGILQHPVDLSMRSYLTAIRKDPFHLYLEPDTTFGRTSAQWIISSAVGVTNPEGKYLGAITLGFDAAELTRRLHLALGEKHLRFALINVKSNIVIQSPDAPIPIEDVTFDGYYDQLPPGEGELKNPIDMGNIRYAYYHRLQNYPYIIIMGYDKNAYAVMMWKDLAPLLLTFMTIGCVFLVILYLFSKRIIHPIISLSQIADKISQGLSHEAYPRKVPHEVYNLAVQLSKIKRYIGRISRIKQAHLLAENAKLKAEQDRTKAQEADQAKSDFLAHVSHELRTPLNAIINFSDIQRNEMFGPMQNGKYLEYAKDIHYSGLHLLQLINNLLDLSKAEANKIDLFDEDLNMNDTIEHCLRSLREWARKEGVALYCDLPANLPLLRADSLRIRQILLNLLSNAIKFTEEGGSITISAIVNHKRELVIRVIDTGIGIAPEDLPNVMKKFGQATAISPKLKRPDGTGLGLPLTKHLVELHDATLSLSSVPHKGTTVTVIFPAARVRERVQEMA